MKSNNLLAVVIAATLSLVTFLAQDIPKTEASDQKQEQSSDKAAMNGMEVKADWEKQGVELDKLVAAMNSASADHKVDVIAALLTKLVEQEKAMRTEMQQQMAASEKNDNKRGSMSMRMKQRNCENK
jgi:hypothetical protein